MPIFYNFPFCYSLIGSIISAHVGQTIAQQVFTLACYLLFAIFYYYFQLRFAVGQARKHKPAIFLLQYLNTLHNSPPATLWQLANRKLQTSANDFKSRAISVQLPTTVIKSILVRHNAEWKYAKKKKKMENIKYKRKQKMLRKPLPFCL